MSSLTVLCPTVDPGPRVRAVLKPLRAVADEVLVCADSRADPGDIAHYAAVADRVVRYERGPTHSGLAWLHEQCRGDWILMVAGDEVASPALVAALPELIARRDVLHVYLPLRWLWRDSATWLRDHPWHPDFHARLVRNDGTLRFLGVKHELARYVEPARFADDLPLWHLSLLLAGEEARRAKVVRNRAERPDLVLDDGTELNDAYYLPEARSGLRTAPVPDSDRAAIEAVLAAPAEQLAEVTTPLHPFAEVQRSWARRPVSAGAFDARLEVIDPLPLVWTTRAPRAVFVRVRNLGDETWPRGLDDTPPFRLGWRWLPSGEEGRAGFPHAVLPGSECVVRAVVDPPANAADRTIEFDVVLENERWFDRATRAELSQGH